MTIYADMPENCFAVAEIAEILGTTKEGVRYLINKALPAKPDEKIMRMYDDSGKPIGERAVQFITPEQFNKIVLYRMKSERIDLFTVNQAAEIIGTRPQRVRDMARAINLESQCEDNISFTRQQIDDLKHVKKINDDGLVKVNAEADDDDPELKEYFAAWVTKHHIHLVTQVYSNGKKMTYLKRGDLGRWVAFKNKGNFDSIELKKTPTPYENLMQQAKQAKASGRIFGYTQDALRIALQISTSQAKQLARMLNS